PSGPVGLETRDPAGRVQLQLQLQRRAPKNRRIHFQRAVARFATLAIADLVTFGVVRELAYLLRDHQWVGTVLAGTMLQAILASASYLDGSQYALTLVVGLWVTGNYGWGDQRRDPFRLLAAVVHMSRFSAMATSEGPGHAESARCAALGRLRTARMSEEFGSSTTPISERIVELVFRTAAPSKKLETMSPLLVLLATAPNIIL